MGLSNEIVIRLKDGSELGIVNDHHVFYDDYKGAGNDFFINWGELSGEAQDQIKKTLSIVEKLVEETLAIGG